MTRSLTELIKQYPDRLLRALQELIRERSASCHIAGGTIRDWLMGIGSKDLDITVFRDGFGWARALADKLDGTFVPLDRKEDVARVAWNDFWIDFSSFREGARSIEEDLLKRDFTINSMAVPFPDPTDAYPDGFPESRILDPAGGQKDLEAKIIRANSSAVFVSDPLRLLRAFRFMAVLGFAIEPVTEGQIRALSHLLHLVAEERVKNELDMILSSGSSFAAVSAMHDNDILPELLPELYHGVGMAQPSSHHLDVFDHGMATLEQMEAVLRQPGKFFPGNGETLHRYLQGPGTKKRLNWTALLHDLGKPETHEIRADRGGRITFYNHDKEGARIFDIIADRLKWSRADSNFVRQLISVHMWPFHLNNARKKTGLTPKAYMRLIKTVGEDFHGLFLLAMADSLAGSGAGKPPGMEEDIATLYDEMVNTYSQAIKPVLVKRLLTGRDLIEIFGLKPGPLFRKIFDELENSQVEGEVQDRTQALKLVKNYPKSHK